MTERVQITARGLVQGVGFRPFVYSLATRLSLSGFVQNDTNGVFIDVEGRGADIREFLDGLTILSPPHAVIEDICCLSLPCLGYEGFSIKESAIKDSKKPIISADLSICRDCLKELFHPNNRRYRYPFINCTNCGPRFTIIKDIPYDRIHTTMSGFTMCADCSEEYHNPANRRFHAQPNACHGCGPTVTLSNGEGKGIQTDDPISVVCALLNEGKIVAIKGIGGYHLACDAANDRAVSLLRERKKRYDKPFAIMVNGIEMVRLFCRVSEIEEASLCSTQRPIVLLKKKLVCAISPKVAPANTCLGVMLPYTPLHHLILAESGLALVMTSGNISDEPIAYADKDAFEHLNGIADYYLAHNREIFMRCDDSIVRINEGRETVIRRSRGYAPFPLKLQYTFTQPVLACGAFLKNTFCLGRDDHAFLSHYIGDLDNTETLSSFERGIWHYKRLFYFEPEVIAHDLHPEYPSTVYAKDQSDSIVKVGVQHHHAHVVSCMAEHGISRKVIGVAFDGLGYGEDGNFWGGEFFVADLSGFVRVGHLDYLPMPGGEQAIKEPWRMAVSYLQGLYGSNILTHFRNCPEREVEGLPIKLEILLKMLSRRINAPLTSSMGRLFDGVASLLGLQHTVTFEGQAAIQLECIADERVTSGYRFDIDFPVGSNGDKPLVIRWQPVVEQIVKDVNAGISPAIISAMFHHSIAAMVLQVCAIISDRQGIDIVILSGGVFQNNFLLSRTVRGLQSQGFEVYFHEKIPSNDGGISLGQAIIASERRKVCV